MNRNEAIEILKRVQKYYKGSDLDQAIDVLISPMQITDEMVERGCVANNRNFPTPICINGMYAALTAALGADDNT